MSSTTTSTTERRPADQPSALGLGVETRTRAVPCGRSAANR